MFLATMFGTSRPYSSEENAEKALAHFIQKTQRFSFEPAEIMPGKNPLDHKKYFDECMSREQYPQAICYWNDYVRQYLWHSTVYLAEVKEVVLDQPFI